MLDRLGKEVDFTEMFMEETLSAKDKKTIPDDQWGLIIKNDKGEIVERKFPLNDETHVRQAAIFFDRAKDLTEDQKRELARNIVRRAKELDMDYSGWESLKPYLDKPVKESYELDPDFTSGTSDFDGYINDDEYYGEADQALMNQIQKNEDNIPILQLRTYAKKCLHEERSYNGGGKGYLFQLPQNDANNQDKRCHGYFLNLIKEMDKSVDNQINRFYEYRPQKWFRYDKLINKFFSSIGVKYARDRVVTGVDSRKQCVHFLEKEFVKFRYDPTTDILIHRSDKKNLPYLKPSHGSLTEGIIYPKPRIYFTLEPRSKYSIKGAYGDNAYEPIISKPIDVYYDTESPAHISIDVSSDKYGKDVFINTYKPLAVRQITSDNTGNNQINQQQTGSQNMSPPPIKESFEEMFGPVIQEAFNAVTGEEIPIKHAYTMEEMKERTFSESELKHVKHNDDLVPVKRPDEDEVYFGSPTNYMPEIDLDGPLFVTPYKGLASIYVGRDIVKSKIPCGNYNLQYEEWGKLGEVDKPLSDVHVYVEGYPFLEQTVVEGEGYIHCVKTKDYTDDFYRYSWMNNREYLIANTDNMKVEFTRSIKCKVKYHIVGKPSPKGKSYGPSKGGILRYIHEIADKIHAKYKADQKDPTGNQNCLLCSWCAEASIRGGEYLPRPVYSPRDSALEIEPEDMITGIKRVNLKGGYHSLLSHLKSAKEPFARWYCHVKWSNSNGGHEFLIVKIDDNSFGIMDAQQGTVKPLNTDDYHVKDIDWSGSYICRIDDKPFKYMKLDQINDPKKTLPWDPKKDIPYMVKHGMCTKEEAEKELKKMETNLFNSELKKALHQTHIQESASDPMTIIPKDLRDWLKKGDYSSLEKDDAYYYVEGHPVEEFFREPEFCKGYFYPDKEDDPILHCIVFSNDNGNGLVYDWTDECYYYAYHDWIDDDTGFLHRERLSSKSWTQINQQQTGSQNMSPPPIKESFEEMFGPVIQEAATRDEKMIHIKPPKTDEVYFGSPTNHMPEIDLDRPLFVSPYKGIASIFIWGDMGLQDRIPKGSYNLNYEEWINFDEKKMKNPLKEVHVYLEGAPFLEPFTVEQEGYIHCISTKDYLNNFFRKPWMTKDLEYLIANTDNMKVEFTRSIKCKVKYHIVGKPSPKGKSYGPSKSGTTKVIPKERVYYRFEYEGEGIYDAYKHHASWLQWYEFKQTYAATWLNIVPNYRNGEKSYFTEEGYKMFMEHTYPEMIKVLDESKIEEIRVNLKPEDIRYEDKYQATTKVGVPEPKPIQEGAWNDIRNGVNPWSKKRVFHITKQGHLDGQIFKPRVPEYLDKYDPSQDKFEDVDNPRICFSNSIEGALNAILVNIGRWKTANKLGDWYVYVPEKPLKEYKYRTTRQLVDERKVYDANVTNEIWIEEPVRLKQYGIIHVDQVSDKHTKKTVPTTTGFVGHRYRYDFKYHWLVKPKVIADLPYDYSPKSVCEDMVSELSGFKYGLGYDGSIHHGSSKDFDEKYRLESPEEFEKNGGGICYDYVEWEAGYLEAYGYTCRKFYISTDTEDMDTHTFILVDDGNGKFIYPEAAFKLLEGTYTVKSLDEAVDMIMKKIWDINDNKSKYDTIKYYVWEYKDHPPYGSDMKTCHEYFTKGEPIGEGMIKNPYKRKD